MEKEEYKIIYLNDNNIGFNPIVAVASKGDLGLLVEPIFNGNVYSNLYGRIMTIVDATVETSRVDAVKSIFKKELNSWSEDVYSSAKEISYERLETNVSCALNPNNIYLK